MKSDRVPRRILYGRRRGPRLRERRRRLLGETLPALAIEPPAPGAQLDPAALFGGAIDEVWLEVGFGAGEHLIAQARDNPTIGFIGCEPYWPGVARLLAAAADAGLDNVRVFTDDARLLIDALPDRSLGRVFVLFPDPWPKSRHHKRRFIQADTLDALARVMKDGALLRFASDHAGYVRWTLRLLIGHPAFCWTARRAADWRERPADWPETRYERKARAESRRSAYLGFVRRKRRKA
jgi:tRNA (guanine-N7-)-methyltransferase